MSTEQAPPAATGRSLISQGTVVSGMTLISRVTGFLRDILLANVFGASGIADAFLVAFRIPNFFRRLFAEGAFAQAFVPVLADYRAGPRIALEHFVRLMFGNLAVAVSLVCIFGVLGAALLIRVFAIGFDPGGERFQLAVELVRITFPYLALVSLSAFAAGVLNTFGQFAVSAFAPVLLNFVFIAILASAGLFGHPAVALAWGVLLGGVLQLAIQVPGIARLGLLRMPVVNFRDPGARRVGTLLMPAVFAASIGQINALIDTMLASTLQIGSVTWLYLSDRLMELPIGLVAVALGTVLLPSLSRRHATDDADGFRSALAWGVQVASLLAIPAAVALYVLALPLIATIFQHGAMSDFDARMAAASLRAFACGVAALVLIKVLQPAFFSRQDTRTPFRIGVVAIAVNVALNLLLYRVMGHVGLAMATSVAAVVNGYLLLRHLWLEGAYRPGRSEALTVCRALVAAAAMAAVLSWLSPGGASWLTMAVAERAATMALCVGAGGGVYLLVLMLLLQRFKPLLQVRHE